jgi:uncharacterized protein YecT (DUF1311 family)
MVKAGQLWEEKGRKSQTMTENGRSIESSFSDDARSRALRCGSGVSSPVRVNDRDKGRQMSYGIISVAMLLVMTPALGIAQSKQVDPCYQGNTFEINQCLGNRLEARDKALNAAYSALLKRLDASDQADGVDYQAVKRQLVDAQRAWISFIKNDCSARYELYAGGTIRGAVYAGCMIAHTERRTNDLRRWMFAN